MAKMEEKKHHLKDGNALKLDLLLLLAIFYNIKEQEALIHLKESDYHKNRCF